jgi:S-adenosyl methyltransferase
VTDRQRPRDGGEQPPEIEIDTTVADPARVHNFLAGGDGHFAVDREAVNQAATILPGGLDTAQRAVRSIVGFQSRVVRYVATEAGIRQFMKLGTAVPVVEDVHEVAHAVAPDARVVYVGNDPLALAHAHSLRRVRPEGSTAYVHASLTDTEAVVRQASATLDFARPVALLLPATLNFVPDDRDPYGIVARLVDAVPSGSYLALTHTSHEIRSERMLEAAERFSKLLGPQYVVRPRDQIARFFDGLDLVEPGLVQLDKWRPDPAEEPDEPDEDRRPAPIFGGVARKP